MKKIHQLYLNILLLIAGFFTAINSGFSVFAETVPELTSSALGTADAGARANFDVKDIIFKDSEDVTVFTRLGLSAMRERANGTKVTYFEQYNRKRRYVPGASQAEGGTSVKFTDEDAAGLVKGMEFKIVTDTVVATNRTTRFVVTSIGASSGGNTTVNVELIYGTTLLAIDHTKDIFILVGIIKEQGAARPEPLNNLLVEKYTYTRIFDASYKVTGSLQSQRLYGETERNRQKGIMFFDHSMDIESAIYNAGAKREPSNANDKKGTAEGIIYTILNESDNVFYETGNTVPGYEGFTVKKLKSFHNGLGSVKNVQGKWKTKIAACNGAMISLYNELAEDSLVYMNSVPNNVLGFEGVKEVRIGQLRLLIFESVQMNDLFPDTDTPAELPIDANFFEVRPYRDTKFLMNVQDNGSDLIQDMVRTELSWILTMPNKHGMFFPKGAY